VRIVQEAKGTRSQLRRHVCRPGAYPSLA